LGLVGIYRKFIANLGVLASPINLLTILSKPEFEKYMEIETKKIAISAAMDTIKVLITLDPYLVLPQKDLDTLMVGMDASDFGIGMILR
jgi:hypothetical protein